MVKKHSFSIILSLVISVVLISPKISSAEENNVLFPLPSVFDFTRGSGWGVALGVGVEYENNYDGADEYEFDVEPVGAIQYRKENHLFFWENTELGWRSRVMDKWLVQLNARYEMGRDTDDSDDGNLDGLEDTDDEIVGSFEIRRSVFGDWKAWLGGRVLIGDSNFGTLGILAGAYRFGSAQDGTGTELIAFATFGTSDFINRDFGITPQESITSGLDSIDLDGGYRSFGVNVLDRRYVTNHLMFIAEAGIELYSSDIQDSPIAREDFEAEVGISLVYQF